MLGAFPTNSKQIEPQLMRKFLLQQQVFSCQMPDPFSALNFNNDRSLTGSVLQTVSSAPANSLQLQSLSHCTIGSSDYETRPCHNIRALPPLKEHILDDSAMSDVRWMYEQLYPGEDICIIERINRICQSCSKLTVCEEVLSSHNTRNSYVAVHWKSPVDSASTSLRFGFIQFFLIQVIVTSKGPKEHTLAVVNWLKPHPDTMYFGSTSFVLRNDFEGINKYSYVPVQRIASRCCFGNLDLKLSAGDENVTVVIPIPFKFSL